MNNMGISKLKTGEVICRTDNNCKNVLDLLSSANAFHSMKE
jgi:DNA helicase IV